VDKDKEVKKKKFFELRKFEEIRGKSKKPLFKGHKKKKININLKGKGVPWADLKVIMLIIIPLVLYLW
jgi:polyisoprenoid-binding protein YceI